MGSDDVLWRSFRNVVHAGAEASAIMRTLGELSTVEKDHHHRDSSHVIDMELKEDTIEDEEGWVTGYWYRAFRIRARSRFGRLAEAGTVTFAISFWRKEDEAGQTWEGARSAKLYVAFDPSRARVRDHWGSDHLYVAGDGGVYPGVVARPPHLWIFDTGATNKPLKEESWFFCLPLGEIEDREALLRRTLEPLQGLLSGKNQEDVFGRVQPFRSGAPRKVIRKT